MLFIGVLFSYLRAGLVLLTFLSNVFLSPSYLFSSVYGNYPYLLGDLGLGKASKYRFDYRLQCVCYVLNVLGGRLVYFLVRFYGEFYLCLLPFRGGYLHGYLLGCEGHGSGHEVSFSRRVMVTRLRDLCRKGKLRYRVFYYSRVLYPLFRRRRYLVRANGFGLGKLVSHVVRVLLSLNGMNFGLFAYLFSYGSVFRRFVVVVRVNLGRNVRLFIKLFSFELVSFGLGVGLVGFFTRYIVLNRCLVRLFSRVSRGLSRGSQVVLGFVGIGLVRSLYRQFGRLTYLVGLQRVRTIRSRVEYLKGLLYYFHAGECGNVRVMGFSHTSGVIRFF